jgi:hypothetical protein
MDVDDSGTIYVANGGDEGENRSVAPPRRHSPLDASEASGAGAGRAASAIPSLRCARLQQVLRDPS